LCIAPGRSTQSDGYRPSIDGTLLSALMGQIFVENRDLFYTPRALDAAVNVNSLHVIVYSRLDRNVQSVTEMLSLKRERGFCT